MCDVGASPRQCVRAEGFPQYPLGACIGYGEPRSEQPLCAELLSPVRTISGSTRDTATTPSPRRSSSRFVWADEDDDDELLLEACCTPDSRLEERCAAVDADVQSDAPPVARPEKSSCVWHLVDGRWKKEKKSDGTTWDLERIFDAVHDELGPTPCDGPRPSPSELGRGRGHGGEAVAFQIATPREAQTGPAAQWKPNAYAPEFIPTTSMDCVMVGVASACLPGRTPGLVGLGAAPVEEVARLAAKACAADVQQPTEADLAGTLRGAASTSRRRRQGAGKGPPAKICTKPAADLHSQASATPRGCTKGLCDIPEATEEEWEHRARLRMRAVEIGKESKEYRLHCETKKGCGYGVSDEPKTPDPHDRTVSKRMWKFLLREWRSALVERERRHLQQGPESVVSTEEWQSVGAAPTEEPESVAAIRGDSDSESASDV